MKIIFLDIDGVLNSDLWRKANPVKEHDLRSHLDPRCMELFNKILQKTNAKIVVSSNWRLQYKIEDLRIIFKEAGCIGEIIDYTPHLVHQHPAFVRGNEILHWCKQNENVIKCKYFNYKDYVIIDDNSGMLFWQASNFFQTDHFTGLTPSKANAIIRFLV